jgi:hypothetical protein
MEWGAAGCDDGHLQWGGTIIGDGDWAWAKG